MKNLPVLIASLLMFLCLSAPNVILAAGDFDEVAIRGFISQGFIYSDEYNYLAHNSKDGSFEYNEIGINFGKALTDKLRVGLQLFSRDLGDAANNKITLDWAYGDYRLKDWLGVRAGRIKLPLGLYNEFRDVDMLRTSIVLPQGIYNDLFRDTLIAVNGLGLYGHVKMGAGGALGYQLLAGATNTDSDSGVSKRIESSLAGAGTTNGNPDNDTTYNGALRWETPLEGLRIGYSRFKGKSDLPVLFGNVLETVIKTSSTIQVYSAEYTWNDLIVASEYMLFDSDSKFLGGESSKTAESYYLSASYRFSDLVTLGAYYAVYYPDKDDKDGDNQAIDHNAWEKDLAMTLRFDINSYWVFKIEGHAVRGTANVMGIDNTDNDFNEEDWYYGAAKATFSF